MKIILENNIKKLIPTEKEYLITKEDFEKPIEKWYYFKFAYLPQTMTLEQCEEIYMEIDKEEPNETAADNNN